MDSPLRVLYVDDEPDLLSIGKLFLEQSGDLAVTTAISAQEGIRLLEQEKFDAIISDYQMPGMDGIQFLVEVRTRFGPTPFILFTGRGREEIVIQAINSGVDFYLQKGGDPSAQFAELVHKVRSAASSKRADDALRESEERYRAIYDQSPIVIELYDAVGAVVHVNPACLKLFGIENIQAIQNFSLFADPNISDEQKEKLRQGMTVHYQGAFDFEKVKVLKLYPTSRKGTIWLDVLITPLGNHPESVAGFLVQIQDITERKVAEEGLITSQALLNTTIDSIPDIIGIQNPDHTIVRYNRAGYEFLHLTPEEVYGRRCYELIGRTRPCEDCATEKALKTKKTGQSERYLPEYGIHLDCRSSPVLDKDGEIVLIVEQLRDITERKRTEDALRTSEGQKTAILDGITTNIAFVDKDLKILWANRFASESVNKSPAEMVGHTCHALWADPARPCENCPTLKVFETKHSEHIIQHTPDGRVWDERGEPVFDENGNLIGVVEIAQDITERKRAEEAVRASHDQLTKSEADLRIHQIELEMQAEELRKAHLALEESRDKFIDLYDFAPLGYFTLSDKALITGVNLTGATLLGTDRKNLVNTRFRKFIVETDSEQWIKYFKDVLGQESKQTCILTLKQEDGSIFPARLESIRLTGTNNSTTTVRVAISDISDMRQKEERFKTLIEVSASGMWVTDAVGNNTYASPQWCRITGITAADALGDGWAKGLHPDDRDRVYHDWRQAALSKETFMSDFRFIHPDGHVVWVLCQALPLKGNEGNFIEWIGTITDITERKVAEEALRKSEEEYRRLVELSSDGIWLLDKEFLTVYVNPAIEEMIGYSPEEMIGRSWYDFGDPEWVLRAKELEKRRESGIGEPHEFLFIHKDGRKVLARISTTPLYDNDGSFDGAIGVLSDITRKKQAEEEIAKSEERFRGLVDTITSGVAIYEVRNNGASGKDYIIKDFNKTALEIEGKKKDEVIGKSLSDLRPAIDEYGLIPVFQQVWETGVPAYFPQKVYIDEKYSNWYENRVFRLQSGEIVAVYDDVTDRKRAEEELKHLSEFQDGVITNARVWLSVLDLNGRILLWNTGAEELSGYTSDEVVGQKEIWKKIYPDPEYRKQVTNTITRIIRDKNYLENFETTILSKKGERRVISWNTKGIPGATGEISDYIAIGVDVTERKRDEEELRFHAEIERNMSDAVYLIRVSDGIIAYSNPSFEKLFGYDQGELIGKHVSVVNAPVDKEPGDVADEIMSSLLTTGTWSGEVLNIRKDGTTFWSFANVITFDHPRFGKVWLSMHNDITEHKWAEQALVKSEARHRTILQTTTDGFYVINSDGKVADVNETYCSMSGYTRAELLKLGITDLDAVEDPADTAERIGRIIANGSEIFETRHRRKDGSVFDVELSVTYQNADGGLFISFCRDITERKRAEEELLTTQRRLGDIINFLPDATFAIDREGKVIAWNRAIEEMTGIRAEDMLGKGDYEYALPFYNERRPILIDLVMMQDPGVLNQYTSVRRDGDALTAETTLAHLGGKDLYLWGKSILFKTDQGDIVGAIESIRDITDRRTAEELLRESRETYRELVESISDVIFEVDRNGNITYISPVVHKVLEFEHEEMTGKNFIEFVYPDDRELLIKRFSELSEAIEHPLDYRVTTKSGGVRWVRTQTKSIMKGKEFTGARGTLIDITERKAIEKEMKFHAHELQRYSTSLAVANKKLNLLSSITRHDIINQLMSVNGFLELLHQKVPDPTLQDFFTRITKASARISAMIQFTKEYEQIGVNAPVWQDCHTLVDTAAKQAPLGKVMVKNDLPTGAEVFADPLIEKVFYNLMDNAVRYGGKITTIRFSAEERDGNHVIVCEDDGNGIPADEKEKIFERGFGKNTGLGLALSKEILDITGITITETGVPDKGARFEITVPEGAWGMTGNTQG